MRKTLNSHERHHMVPPRTFKIIKESNDMPNKLQQPHLAPKVRSSRCVINGVSGAQPEMEACGPPAPAEGERHDLGTVMSRYVKIYQDMSRCVKHIPAYH